MLLRNKHMRQIPLLSRCAIPRRSSRNNPTLSRRVVPWLGMAMLTGLLGLAPSARSAEPKPADELQARIPALFEAAANQYQFLLSSLKGQTNQPRTFVNGKLQLVGPRDWTSGFFPGSLWRLYEFSQDPKWKAAAKDYTEKLEGIQNYGGSHDVGFMLSCSYGNGYRLTHDPRYRDVLIQGARTLSTRFNPVVGMIRSWDHGGWQYRSLSTT